MPPFEPIAPDEPIDLVCTWVDGDWPGYPELLGRWARRPVDLNPNRYRDNLELLRYGLRSVARHAPWIRRVYVVTCRPQVPRWLDRDAPGLRLVHHDELIPAERLPTFSSFAIVAHLHRLPDVARAFLYLEDDRLLDRPLARADLVAPDGLPWIRRRLEPTPAAARAASPALGPWDRALAEANGLLDARYGPRRRWSVKKAPLLVERGSWEHMWALWPEALLRTASSRFRAPGCVAPEHLYPWLLLHEGWGRPVPWPRAYAETAYVGLENRRALMRLELGLLRRRRPAFVCLNDNFGDRVDPEVEARARRYLEARHPAPSPFERRAAPAAADG